MVNWQEVSSWRSIVPEEKQNEMIGELVRQKREAEIGFENVNANVKQVGERLEKLGSLIKNTVAGGDYKDLLNPLEKVGIGTAGLDTLLKERNRLAGVIQECTKSLNALGIS